MQNRKPMYSLAFISLFFVIIIIIIIIIVIITLSNQCVGEGLHVDSQLVSWLKKKHYD